MHKHQQRRQTNGIPQPKMWLVQRVAKQLKCAEEEIDSLTPLSDLGLESTEMMQIVGEMKTYGRRDSDLSFV